MFWRICRTLIGAFYMFSTKKTFAIVLLLQIRIIKLTFDVLVKVNMQKYQKTSNNFFSFSGLSLGGLQCYRNIKRCMYLTTNLIFWNRNRISITCSILLSCLVQKICQLKNSQKNFNIFCVELHGIIIS